MAQRRVVLAYSGGLDSTAVAILLKERYGFEEVVPVLVDVGQGEEEISVAKDRCELLGLQLEFIDAKEEFATEYITRCIKANGRYEGYPVGTSMSRALIAQKVSEVARRLGAGAVAHGCTGKGNDQFRMEGTFRYFLPEVTIVAPVRELNLNRAQEEEILRERGLEPGVRRGRLGGDVNMWSHSIGSGQVEDLKSQYPEDYIWVKLPERAPDKPTTIRITFEGGVPVKVDGITDMVEMIHYLNRVGGENGIGIIDILEDGMIGLKSRELYEAPAATILLDAHADLERLTLTKEQLRLKAELDRIWADIVYHAMWFHPLRRDIDAFIDSTQRFVSGEVEAELYKGSMRIVSRESRDSLFLPEFRSVKRGGLDQREATGLVNLFSLQFGILGEKGR